MGGKIPQTCEKDAGYFLLRHCFIDVRGPLVVHKDSYWGYGIKVVTAGHDFKDWPNFGIMCARGVTVDEGAFIGSFSILHNCHICAHAMVSIGAVVNGITVPEYGVAVGNPASVVGYYHKGLVLPYSRWVAIREK